MSLGPKAALGTVAYLLVAAAAGQPLPAPTAVDRADAARKAIIEQAIAAYPGNCPCPYNTASNGSRCGRRSAYDRRGGHAPLCYPQDVTDEMVRAYLARNRR